MLSMKAGALMLTLWFALGGAEACEGKRRQNAANANQSANVESQSEAGAVKDNLKVLSRGQQSPLSNAFIFVARDAATYDALRKVVTGLPELEQNFFESNLVAAAFLGERRTGGYGVEFRRAINSGLRIEETRPPKDAMTTQAITQPYTIVGVPLGSNQTMPRIDAGDAWKSAGRAYAVTEGEFTMTGGIAGRSEKFGIEGSVRLMREGNLATLIFELQSKGGAKRRVLVDAASGTVGADGTISITRLGSGSFVDMPADALNANVQLAENGNKLSLTFASTPGNVADGYNGRGSLTATARR